MIDTLENIKQNYAKEKGSEDWETMIQDYGITEQALDEIAKRYATECVKASLEKASESAKIEKEYSVKYQDFIPDGVDKESITDESNIILL